MDDLVERKAFLASFEVAPDEWCKGQTVRRILAELPAVDAVPVAKELRPAVRLLHKEYERAKKSPFVRNPLAYALYQTWKAVENGR